MDGEQSFCLKDKKGMREVEKTTFIMYLFEAMQDGEKWQRIRTKAMQCGIDKIRILWEILFETDIYDAETLKSKIYEYGSCLKESDHLGRELFVIMATFVQ